MKSWRLWLGIAISLAFLYVAFRDLHWVELGQTLAQANYWFLFPAIAAYFVGVWVRAMRWHSLLSPMRPISSSRLFPVIVIGYMANDVLPARMGELVRAYVLAQREGIRKSASMATIIIERTFDGVVMLIFLAIASSLATPDPNLQRLLRLGSLLFLVLLVGFFALALWPALSDRLISVSVHLLPSPLQTSAERMARSFLSGLQILQSWRGIGAVLALSLAAWLFEAAMYYLLSLGFSLNLPLSAFLLTVAIANLGTLVPSSPGYVGTFDALAIFALTLYGVSRVAASSYVLVLHAELLVPVTLLGFFYLWREQISLRGLERGALVATPDRAVASASEGGR